MGLCVVQIIVVNLGRLQILKTSSGSKFKVNVPFLPTHSYLYLTKTLFQKRLLRELLGYIENLCLLSSLIRKSCLPIALGTEKMPVKTLLNLIKLDFRYLEKMKTTL